MYQVAVVLAALAVASANLHDRAYYEEKFFDWMQQHNVEIPSGQHFITFLNNFAVNDDLISTTNAQNHSYKLGHNKFSHMGRAEWKQFVQGFQKPANKSPMFVHRAPEDISTLADSKDWRTTDAVRSVKDQGQCGSCWSFSATGALEASYFQSSGKSLDFSPQEFVDCDNRKNSANKGTDMGCNGGLMDSAFDWASKNKGLCEWNAYGNYNAANGDCHDSSCKQADMSPSGFVDVTPNSDSAMMSALNIRPVAVAIEADQAAFQLYKSGVFTAACGTSLDHGVLAVGYGNMDGLDHYIVKNSWGTGWGDNGYIYFQRGAGVQKEGQCGILMEASYSSHNN